MIVEKILRTLNPKYDHIVVTIKESKNIEELKVENLHEALLAQMSNKSRSNFWEGFQGWGHGRS